MRSHPGRVNFLRTSSTGRATGHAEWVRSPTDGGPLWAVRAMPRSGCPLGGYPARPSSGALPAQARACASDLTKEENRYRMDLSKSGRERAPVLGMHSTEAYGEGAGARIASVYTVSSAYSETQHSPSYRKPQRTQPYPRSPVVRNERWRVSLQVLLVMRCQTA